MKFRIRVNSDYFIKVERLKLGSLWKHAEKCEKFKNQSKIDEKPDNLFL